MGRRLDWEGEGCKCRTAARNCTRGWRFGLSVREEKNDDRLFRINQTGQFIQVIDGGVGLIKNGIRQIERIW